MRFCGCVCGCVGFADACGADIKVVQAFEGALALLGDG